MVLGIQLFFFLIIKKFRGLCFVQQDREPFEKILLYPLSGGRDMSLGKEKLEILKPFLPIPANSALRLTPSY